MFFEQRTEPRKVMIEIETRGPDIPPQRYDDLSRVLQDVNVLQMISNKTGLQWTQPRMIIKHGDEAQWEGVDTVIVDFRRGYRAVSSLVHEALHVMLRQIKWTDHPSVTALLKRYPELRQARMGEGYAIEQMFAYLLQNEIYTELEEILHQDFSKQIWGHDHFEMVMEKEYPTQFLKRLGRAIIQTWSKDGRPHDIFVLIGQVSEQLKA